MAVTFTLIRARHHYMTYHVAYDGVFAAGGNLGTRTNAQLLVDVATAPGGAFTPLRDELATTPRDQAACDIDFGGDRVDFYARQGVSTSDDVNAPIVVIQSVANLPQLVVNFNATATIGGVVVTLRYQGRAGAVAGR